MNNKTRQKKLKALGYYHEKIDEKNSKEFTKAILAIQKDYFPKRYQDGKPGPQTDKLIQMGEITPYGQVLHEYR